MFLLYIQIQSLSRIIYKQIRNMVKKIQTCFAIRDCKTPAIQTNNLFVWLDICIFGEFLVT